MVWFILKYFLYLIHKNDCRRVCYISYETKWIEVFNRLWNNLLEMTDGKLVSFFRKLCSMMFLDLKFFDVCQMAHCRDASGLRELNNPFIRNILLGTYWFLMFYCMVVLRFPTMLIATEVIRFGGFCLTSSPCFSS